MNPFPFLKQRVTNTPIAIHPDKGGVIMGALAERLGVTQITVVGSDGAHGVRAHAWADDDDWGEEGSNPRGGYDVVEGVAIIQVRGTTVQRTGSLRPYSGMTGYDGLRQNFMLALVDPAVDGIVFDIDSPGGEVCGCFDLVDTIYEARGVKPIGAILNENAYSAAYALASAVDPGSLYVPRTGGTGSVGVIYIHLSYEGMLDKAGVQATLVTKGAFKGEGTELKNLSKETFARLKADVVKVGELFDRTVARNRGLKVSAVAATEAGTFLGAEGVEIGFADKCMAPDAAFRDFLKRVA
jgi:ClpP class serine protease